jgi:hypothetical protein
LSPILLDAMEIASFGRTAPTAPPLKIDILFHINIKPWLLKVGTLPQELQETLPNPSLEPRFSAASGSGQPPIAKSRRSVILCG